MKYLHICEVCGKTEVLTPDEAFEQGWDYPPRMGAFGVLSPRTCGDCGMVDTLWWRVMYNNLDVNNLSDKDKETLTRIANEPDSIMCNDS